jgi:Vacuolar protein sorting-associated protein 62
MILFYKIVALQHHFPGVQQSAFQSVSSVLSALSPSTFATSTFQYLPAESSETVFPTSLSSKVSQTSSPDIPTGTAVDYQGFPDSDDLPGSEFFPRHSLERCELGPLTEVWLSIQRIAWFFMRWCREIFCLSRGHKCENSFAQTVDDYLYDDEPSWQYAPPGTKIEPDALGDKEGTLSQIPQYVMDYAPLVHLYSAEEYWPCDIGEHLQHITPQLNFTPIQATRQHPRLDNLDGLNQWERGRNVFLTSNDNVEDHPEWLTGEKNIPAAPAPFGQQIGHHVSSQTVMQKDRGGRSDAPAVLVVVDKGHGIVDAFWFFFYSFNLGNVVFLRFGNHVGDWEHSVVRFHNGKPKAVFVSEHFFGQAYSYRAVEKVGRRPVIYSATGTHAMYAAPGMHSYILPWGLLHDQTDKGPLWDPALNSHMYKYDLHNDILRSSNFTPEAPTEWFHFSGHWGDKQYPLGDPRQYLFAGNYHYVSGPLGPKFKNLGRRKICQGRESERCVIKNWLGGSRLRRVQRPFGKGDTSEEELG